jgi:hypothetical protein
MVPFRRSAAWRSWVAGFAATAGLFQALASSERVPASGTSLLDSLLPPQFRLPPGFNLFGDGSISDPFWKRTNIGKIHFLSRGDQRRNRSHRGGENEFETYRINEEGLILGEELFGLARPLERAFFDQVMRSQGRQGDFAQLYRDYLKQTVDQGVATLGLNRILDQESVKRRISPQVSYERKEFLARAVLIRFAMDSGKMRTIGEGDQLRLARDARVGVSDERMYGWLKEAAGERAVAFNFDWSFKEGQDYEFEELKQEIGGAVWPSVRLVFDRLPADYYAFLDAVGNQLKPSYRKLVRSTVWRTIIAERRPNLVWESLFAVTTTELAAMYEALQGQFRIQPQTARITDFELSGSRSQEFKARFLALLAERQSALLRDLFGSTPPGPTTPQATPEEQERLRLRIVELRASVPREVFQATLAEFSGAVQAGELIARAVDRELGSDGVTPIPNDTNPENVRKRSVFSPVFSATALFPRLETVASDGKVTLLVLREQVRGTPTTLPATDERVERVLREKIQSKTQGKVFREMAYTLFRENRFESMVDTCADPAWPCHAKDALALAEALFPERLYPGRTYGLQGPGRPTSSSLADSNELPKVMEISLDLFARVFDLSNEGRRPESSSSPTPR